MSDESENVKLEKIRRLLLESGLAELPEGLNEDLQAYGLDSLTVVLFVVAAEKNFDLKINPVNATIKNFSSLGAILKLLDPQNGRPH